ncbi:MAG: hypothetical protein JWQ78_1236 [Sediminibacterium sp.]|nr:hypothetical protein [Sediminibacterium sp.]
MLVQLTKNTGKPHIIKYTRDNGTATWMQADDFFVMHDLSHYAIETVLGYKTAFNGMLNNGMGIRDFEDREKRKAMEVTAEAMYAENMANLFLAEIGQGDFEDFNAMQQETFTSFARQYPGIVLPLEKIREIRNFLRQLLAQWNQLTPGETLALSFSL